VEGQLQKKPSTAARDGVPQLFRISDASGKASFEPVQPVSVSSLSSTDAFLLDNTGRVGAAIYVWIGKDSTLNERRLAVEYAQRYLHERRGREGKGAVGISIVKMLEGRESAHFMRAMSP
jgi:gelsolin